MAVRALPRHWLFKLVYHWRSDYLGFTLGQAGRIALLQFVEGQGWDEDGGAASVAVFAAVVVGTGAFDLDPLLD